MVAAPAAVYTRRMAADHDRRERVKALLIGGVVGASAALAAARRARPRAAGAALGRPVGLAAFEDAPCYREAVEAERARQART
jgi:hypothetical protein